MKKNYPLLFLIFILNCALAYAQIPATAGGPEPTVFKPPVAIEEKFKKEFPDVVPAWHIDENLYLAEFTDTVVFKGRTIGYDKRGNILRRETELENSSYPAAINTYFVKNYPGEKFKTWKSRDEKGVERYCIKRESGTLWFDKEGNYIAPEKKTKKGR